jgi:hypothetical protein
VNTQEARWLITILNQGRNCYLWEANTHYYPVRASACC